MLLELPAQRSPQHRQHVGHAAVGGNLDHQVRDLVVRRVAVARIFGLRGRAYGIDRHDAHVMDDADVVEAPRYGSVGPVALRRIAESVPRHDIDVRERGAAANGMTIVMNAWAIALRLRNSTYR